jgi:hypothetical protein
MQQSSKTCVIDGAPAKRKSKTGNGYWCDACATWFRKHGTDPAARKRHRTVAPGATCSVDGCDRSYLASGYCRKHYQKWALYGDPTVQVKRSPGVVRHLLTEAAYTNSDKCLFLDGVEGRTVVNLSGKGMIASRAVWVIRHGDPGDRYVLHSCNGGSGSMGCINIRHLRLGDHDENMADKAESGHVKGERHPAAVLTEDAVRRARSEWVRNSRYPHPGSSRALAERYGVDPGTMRMAMNGRHSWTHVE